MKLSEIKALIKSAVSHLYDHEEAEAIAKGYMADKLRISFSTGWDSDTDIKLPEFFNEDIRQLTKGSPLQYITGIQHFSGQEFKVNKAVLIPRPETEELVAWILDDLKKNYGVLHILDIGTGSGCIPVMLKLRHSLHEVYATDISQEALAIAAENADKLKVKINFRQESILDPDLTRPVKYDIIISNPPYIPLSDSKSIAINVMDFEPHSALFSPDDDPILYYKAISDYATQYLKMNGVVYLEINPDFAESVVAYLKMSGLGEVIVRKDMSEHFRFIKATRVNPK